MKSPAPFFEYWYIYNKNDISMKKIIRLTENDLNRLVKKVIIEGKSNPKNLKEFFDYEDNRGKNFGYFDKMSSQLGKFVMTSVSIIGREKTAELLSSVAEMINYANNDDTSSQSDYRQLDITSDIMDYLSEIE
jgi:hypothetical protein